MPKYSVYYIDWDWYLYSCEEILINTRQGIIELEWTYNFMSELVTMLALVPEHDN